jgi:hypothetical protein
VRRADLLERVDSSMHDMNIFLGHRPKAPTDEEIIAAGKTLAKRLNSQPTIRLSKPRALRPGESPEFPPMGGESFPPLIPVQRAVPRRCPCCGR